MSPSFVMFDWPSLGNALGYLPDREHARDRANDLADVLSARYEYMRSRQIAATEDPANACKAKISVIAHSMGNYLMEKAMAVVWTRKNQPLLMSLINQFLMVATDVDNLKHFGKRRMGRSGIDHDFPVPDNVWDVDCSSFFTKETVPAHSRALSGR